MCKITFVTLASHASINNKIRWKLTVYHKTQFAAVGGWLFECFCLKSDSKRKCENTLCNYILFSETFNIQNRIISQRRIKSVMGS